MAWGPTPKADASSSNATPHRLMAVDGAFAPGAGFLPSTLLLELLEMVFIHAEVVAHFV